MKNIFWIIGIGLLVLVIVFVLIGAFYLGPIVKMEMERVGPKVTQVSIKVDGVDVSLLTGSAKLKGLIVGNPSGYTAPQAISVGTITVSMDTLSVISSKILVHSIQVESPEITFEGGLLSGNNLSKIADNVNSSSKSSNPVANTTSTESNKPAPKIEVDDFLITGAKVQVILSGVVNKEISLPDIHLTNLGRDSNGLTPAELSSAIFRAISQDTLKVVTSSVGSLAQGVQGLGKSAVSTVGGGVKSVASSLGGLLGK